MWTSQRRQPHTTAEQTLEAGPVSRLRLATATVISSPSIYLSATNSVSASCRT